MDLSWKSVTEPILQLYTEATDGSSIEKKETALVWNYQDADADFGSWQAKELLVHLESVLTNEPVAVKRGHKIIEIKQQVNQFHPPFNKLILFFISFLVVSSDQNLALT